MGILRKAWFAIIILAGSVILGQGLTTDLSESQRQLIMIRQIESGVISDDLFLEPVREKRRGGQYLNLLASLDTQLKLEPVWAMRWSSAGFELNPDTTPGSVLWVTPGLKLSGTLPLFAPYANIWLYVWGRFDKHTAFSFDKMRLSRTSRLFRYSPYLSADFHTQTIEPEYGVDFDQGQGGIALMTPKMELVLGKFKTAAGPSPFSNLGLSGDAPPSAQIRFHYAYSEKFHFSYSVQSLYSNVVDGELYEELYTDTLGITRKYPMHPRYITHHRIDILPLKNLRFGLYEQVIFGGREFAFEYFNPIFPYWSAQHSLGDLDNIQMGLDWEYTIRSIRLYGAFFMDEWAPFDTFDPEENHNWFAVQTGFSLLTQLLDKTFLLTTEYTWCDPRTFIHRFAINQPQHYGYQLGFWAGGNSEQWILDGLLILDEANHLSLNYISTRRVEQDDLIPAIYQDNYHEFLSGTIQSRQVSRISLEHQFPFQIAGALSGAYFDTRNLAYGEEHFYEIVASIRYNIPH